MMNGLQKEGIFFFFIICFSSDGDVTIRCGNSCQWVVFVSCQYMNRVNIRQPKPDTNNKRVNIR